MKYMMYWVVIVSVQGSSRLNLAKVFSLNSIDGVLFIGMTLDSQTNLYTMSYSKFSILSDRSYTCWWKPQVVLLTACKMVHLISIMLGFVAASQQCFAMKLNIRVRDVTCIDRFYSLWYQLLFYSLVYYYDF